MVELFKVENSSDMFVNRGGYESETGIHLATNLTENERELAARIYGVFNGLMGLAIVQGDPGSGKDLFSNWLTHRIKTFFPWKRIVRDEKPRQLYGKYDLFNDKVLAQDLARMKALAVGKKIVDADATLEKAADDWVASEGSVLLKQSVLYCTEYWKYCYSRNPHSALNKTMGSIAKTKRHLDCLILGTAQAIVELDKNTCLKWVDWLVSCVRSKNLRAGFTFFVHRVRYDARLEHFQLLSRPDAFAIDAAIPRSDLGDGKIIIRRPEYQPEDEEERVVLEVLKAGVDTYDELVRILETDGDMSERETLATVKDLKLRLRKHVIDYPCWYSLYNSKSVPVIATTLRAED